MATQMRPLQPDNGADMRNVQIPTTMEGPPSVFERRTKSGRVLRYQLTILQQPERARACGSGSKSAADRRPVDPPPVVELLIFDITNGQEKDITFSYNVNFFLFATLEHARPMAHGRVQTPSATSPPVLTGMPVSGMAYLDRPTVAGYFLFPDLSVRHEGRYRLAFNLYEEIKDAGDASIDPTDKISNANPGPSFDWRMEVKSNAFTVYSAKKFPGLTESTLLSRTVADQGCRVRIRRDVRMRTRENKEKNRNPQRNEPREADRVSRTPDRQPVDQYRGRSMSNHNVAAENRMAYPVNTSAPPQYSDSHKMSTSDSYLNMPPAPHRPSYSTTLSSTSTVSSFPGTGCSTYANPSTASARPMSPHSNYVPQNAPNPAYNTTYSNSNRPHIQGYDHNSASNSYHSMEVDSKAERHNSVSRTVQQSPRPHCSSEYEKRDHRLSIHSQSYMAPDDITAIRLATMSSLPPPADRRDMAPTGQIMPEIPPTAPPASSSGLTNSVIEADTIDEEPAYIYPYALPTPLAKRGSHKEGWVSRSHTNKRNRAASPSDSQRVYNRGNPNDNMRPSERPNIATSDTAKAYMANRQLPIPSEVRYMTADGTYKAKPLNRFI
ncbi:hypothetical protein Cpir12675_004407 [Ceratocystis pirilliformis]|uniref:Velvet domain-containing protein n=1 Tax=Ceratocystis pirilliformis TaxID=259994 RepID=A0ABR3YXY7_9PEZI